MSNTNSEEASADAPDLITIGRVSIDLYPHQQGPMSNVTSFQKSIGGTATNVAVAAARLGHRAAVVTKVGDDAFGLDVRHALTERFGVDATYVSVHPHLPTPLAFAELDPVEEPSIIFYRYPEAPDFQLGHADLDAVPIEDAAILWIPASRFSVEPSRSAVVKALDRRERRWHTIFDLDWRPHFWPSEGVAHAVIEPLIEQFTIVIGNRQECRVAVGSDDPDEAADRLLAKGVEAAVVKLGGDGVLVAKADGTRTEVAPFPVEVVCGLGAGDAFGGAFCHGLLSGWSIEESVRYGNAAGAIVAGRLLCADDMPYVEEVDEFLAGREESS
ncbi:MAG: 5-dehydro-2-deoxygluconokinase [Acidimicrobiia bacterium]|nr:5-dehydro-2-deoxygluconokinase [Acidimicrobiia bacterium]